MNANVKVGSSFIYILSKTGREFPDGFN